MSGRWWSTWLECAEPAVRRAGAAPAGITWRRPSGSADRLFLDFAAGGLGDAAGAAPGAGQADLLISKGDANYRRWLGDRHWPFTTPFRQILAYRPAPLLVLRVLKSEIVVGLTARAAGKDGPADPTWMYDGRWGLIQFVE